MSNDIVVTDYTFILIHFSEWIIVKQLFLLISVNIL